MIIVIMIGLDWMDRMVGGEGCQGLDNADIYPMDRTKEGKSLERKKFLHIFFQ